MKTVERVRDGTLTPPKISGCQAKLDAVCGLLLVNGPCGGWDGVRLESVCCDGQRSVQLRRRHSPSPPLLGAPFSKSAPEGTGGSGIRSMTHRSRFPLLCSLGDNKIGDVGAEGLGKALETNTTLEILG